MIGYPRGSIKVTTMAMWIAGAAGFGWLCLSTVRRVKIFAATMAGGAIALGGVFGLMVADVSLHEPPPGMADSGMWMVWTLLALVFVPAGMTVGAR